MLVIFAVLSVLVGLSGLHASMVGYASHFWPTASGTCGNGHLDVGEACDDNDNMNGDGCSATCAVEAPWSCYTRAGNPSVCFLDDDKSDAYPTGEDLFTKGMCTHARGMDLVDKKDNCNALAQTRSTSYYQVREAVFDPSLDVPGCTYKTINCPKGTQCQDGACAPAQPSDPTCGNNIVEAGEECEAGSWKGVYGTCDACQVTCDAGFTEDPVAHGCT